MPTKAAIRREQDKQRKHRTNVLLVIAGITVTVAVGASQIWYARQAAASNRPNISVQAIIPKPFTPGLSMVVIAQLRNFGNKEAYNVSARSTLTPGFFKTDQDAFDSLTFINSPSENRLIIAPGEGMQQNLITPYILRPQDYPLIMNGTLKVYFISEITYADSSGEKYGKQVCQFYDPTTQLMTFCQTHNSSY